MRITVMKSNLTRQKGFTLLELVTVILIGTVLLTIGIWAANSLFPGYRINGACAMIRGDLNHARVLAAKTRRECRVEFTTNSYKLRKGNLSSGSSSWSDVFEKTFSEYNGVSVVNISNPTFSPRGTCADHTITLKNSKGTTKKITVNVAGRVKVL